MNGDKFNCLHDEHLEFCHLAEEETQGYVNNIGYLSALVMVHRYERTKSYRNALEKWIERKKTHTSSINFGASKGTSQDLSKFLKFEKNCISPSDSYTQKNSTIIFWVDNGICSPLTQDMNQQDIIVVAARPIVKFRNWSIRLCPLSKTSLRDQNELYDKILFVDINDWFEILRESDLQSTPVKKYCNIRIRTNISMHVVRVEREIREADGQCSRQENLWQRN